MEILIRKGQKTDVPAAHSLIQELAVYEKAPTEVTNTIEDMLRDGFGDKPVFEMLVAEVAGEVVGIAIYFTKYSTWKGKGIYLDDIVVSEQHRRKGIGKLLFDKLITECKIQNAKQLHWQVLDWNQPAIDFYKNYMSSFDNEWINCKLSEEQIINFK